MLKLKNIHFFLPYMCGWYVYPATEMRILTTLLEEIKAQNQTSILLLQQLVARSLAGAELDMGSLPEGLVLPVHTIEEIDHLDIICQDVDMKGKVVRILCNYISTNLFIGIFGCLFLLS